MLTRSPAVIFPQQDPSYLVRDLFGGIGGIPGNLSLFTTVPHIASFRRRDMRDVDIPRCQLDSRCGLSDERTEESDGSEDGSEAVRDLHGCLEVGVGVEWS